MAVSEIVHNAAASRFEAKLNAGIAVLEYRIEGSTIFMLHVEVPASEQGQGIAGRLTRMALKFARDSGLSVSPRCPFIAAYVRRNPELLRPIG